METRGRKRKFNRNIPAHIDQNKLPSNCYFEPKGAGHWYTTYQDDRGKKRRKRIAGMDALLSDLHKIIEAWNGIERDTFKWLSDLYFESPKYQSLKPRTQREYRMYFNTVSEFPTKVNKSLGLVPISRWDSFLVQKVVDKLSKSRGPTAARHAYSFIRLVFTWGKNRGHCANNPAMGIELPKEKKKQKLPSKLAYSKLLAHAKDKGTHKQKVAGSCAYYLWVVMELEYLCRMRGIECRHLTDASIKDDGLMIHRTKGSRDNLVLWNDRLKEAIEFSLAVREIIWKRLKKPYPIKAEARHIIVSYSGGKISSSGYHSAWQRFVNNAIKNEIITKDERFSLHDLKRKGVTDTEGNRHDKQEASGHRSSAMMDVYDKSIPRVKPASE